MAQALAIMKGIGMINATVAGLMGALGARKAYSTNASNYESQARNIETAKGIMKGQYATGSNILQGTAVTTAGRSGVKFSGTTAQSISRSLTQLNLDKGYQVFNLNTEKVKAENNARLSKWQADNALIEGFFSTTASVLGSAGSSTFFSSGGASQSNASGNLSGGYDYSNKAMLQPTRIS